MSYEVKIIADSVGFHDNRLVTFQLKYPRYIHAELMTHRMFSRSASSSRAIPVNKLAATTLENMVYPIRWGMNQAGMQASMEDLSPEDQEKAKLIWREAAEYCAKSATMLATLGLHKQWANRMLEWFGTISVVVTATEFDNFFHLRCHKDAQPEIRQLADMMKEVYDHAYDQRTLDEGEWHLPYVTADERKRFATEKNLLAQVSAARCARVSYLNHDGTAPDILKDLELFDRLAGSMPAHLSPLEHAAKCQLFDKYYFNLRGFSSYRYFYEQELQNLEKR